MSHYTCPHCGDSYPSFDVAHVCSKGPHAMTFAPLDISSHLGQLTGSAWMLAKGDMRRIYANDSQRYAQDIADITKYEAVLQKAFEQRFAQQVATALVQKWRTEWKDEPLNDVYQHMLDYFKPNY